MALVTRVAMGTLNNRRFINMATVPVGTAKTFRKFIRSVIQVCNIAMEKKNSLELETLDPNFNFSREFLFSGKMRIEKVNCKRAWQSLALVYNFLYICKQLNFDLPWVWIY